MLKASSRFLWKNLQRARARTYSIMLAPCFREFGKRATVVPPLRFSGSEYISIGTGVYVGSGCWLMAMPQVGEPSPRLIVEEGCSLAGDCVLSATCEVVLEREVLLARNVYIADHRHRFADRGLPVLRQGIEGADPVRIGKGAWLAQNVVVLPGVRVGVGSVVGANSVVTEDVPDWSLAVGAPARVVRSFGP